VLEVLRGRFQLSDNSGERVEAAEMVVPCFALRAGRRCALDSPLVPAPIALAA
jgi:dihydroorotase